MNYELRMAKAGRRIAEVGGRGLFNHKEHREHKEDEEGLGSGFSQRNGGLGIRGTNGGWRIAED